MSNITRTEPIDRWIAVRDLMGNDATRAVLEALIPEVIASGMADRLADLPLGVFLTLVVPGDPALLEGVLEQLAPLPNPAPRPMRAPAPTPSANYEHASVPEGSAALTVHVAAPAVEIVLAGPTHGNPFIDVELTAVFTRDEQKVTVGGFYDGDGTYRLRFLPPSAGEWSVQTRSNARSLTGLTTTFTVADVPTTSPVRVDGELGFVRPDGAAFVPVGTTAYAWTHQPEEVQERTLTALAGTPFTKLRMGLFPKSYVYNSNEPDRFVFPRADDGGFDTERFDVEYFRRLEHRIGQLADLGVEADLILFHPYDRWGFSSLGAEVDDRYVRYVVRRLAAMPNVWWSLANEYELLLAKRPVDWDRLGRLVEREDHVGHPRSIHNIVEPWDASSDWVTHCSLQRNSPALAEYVDSWRREWRKPVVVDEMGYEGDLDQGWGNLTAEELVLRSWQVAFAGGFSTHGETFWSADDEIFWAKGGDLRGESIARIGFLRQVIEDSPTGRLEPLLSPPDAAVAGAAGRYVVISLGRGRPRFRNVQIPEGTRARVEILDCWNMTVTAVPGEHEGTVRVELPARPMIAIRLHLTRLA